MYYLLTLSPILLICQFLCFFKRYWFAAKRNTEVELGTEGVVAYEIETLFHSLIGGDVLLVSLHLLLRAIDSRVDEVSTGSLVCDYCNKELLAKDFFLDTLDN